MSSERTNTSTAPSRPRLRLPGQLTILCVTHLDKVRFEVARYEHQLLVFDVRESSTGTPTLVIALKPPLEGVDEYMAAVHPRDIDHPQFEWTFQRFLYDCIHDYMAELFTRNPQESGPVK